MSDQQPEFLYRDLDTTLKAILLQILIEDCAFSWWWWDAIDPLAWKWVLFALIVAIVAALVSIFEHEQEKD